MQDRVIVQCGIKVNNEYWFVAGNTNGLFKKNFLTGQIDFIGFFPQERKLGFRLYSSIEFIDNILVFAPCHADNIAFYYIEEKKFFSIPIVDDSGKRFNRYMRLVQYHGVIYFIPFWAASFIKYNIYEKSFEVLDSWEQLCNQYKEQKTDAFIIEEICLDNNYIYMFTSLKNQVVIFNMDTDLFEIKNLHIPADNQVTTVCKWDRYIFMITNKNRIYKWDYERNVTALCIEFNKYMKSPEPYTHYVCATGKYIYLINGYDKQIRMYDYVDNKFTTIDMEKYVSDKKDDELSFYYYFDIHHIDSDKICLFSFYDGKYIVIEGERVSVVGGGFFLPDEYWQQDFSEEIISKDILKNLGISYADWISRTLIKNVPVQNKKTQQKKIGEIIYDAVVENKI